MSDLLHEFWSRVLARTTGPMSLRFYFQPALSLFFAVRAGLRDGRANEVPYFWRFLASKSQRVELAGDAWRDVGKVFIAGIVLDGIYQWIAVYELKTTIRLYPLESVFVACCLAIVPYLIFRGIANRIFRAIHFR